MPDSRCESPGSNTSGIRDRVSARHEVKLALNDSQITDNDSRNGGRRMKEGLSFVMGVNLIIWCGIALYLFILDRRIKKLEERNTDT